MRPIFIVVQVNRRRRLRGSVPAKSTPRTEIPNEREVVMTRRIAAAWTITQRIGLTNGGCEQLDGNAQRRTPTKEFSIHRPCLQVVAQSPAPSIFGSDVFRP